MGGALSILTSLGSVANQYGEAKNEKSAEDFARSEKLKQMSTQDAYLQLAKQQEERQQQEFEFKKKSGEIIPMGDGRFWSVSQQKFLEQPKVDEAEVFKQFFDQNLDPREKKLLAPRLHLAAQRYPYDKEKMLGEAQSEADKVHQEIARQDAATLAETNRQQDKKDLQEFQSKQDEQRRRERLEDRKNLMDYSKNLMGLKPTADEVRRADLAENVNENLDALEEIVKRRPELFGPLHGTFTTLRGKVGTSDQDIAALEQIRDNLGRALQGAHGMRSATGVISAGNSVLNGFRNSDKAILSAIDRARSSVGTFIGDVQRKAGAGAAGPPQPSGATQRFTSGGKTYNIPADKVAEFKKDHPDAR
jgi:hypothetical protein